MASKTSTKISLRVSRGMLSPWDQLGGCRALCQVQPVLSPRLTLYHESISSKSVEGDCHLPRLISEPKVAELEVARF